MTVDAGDVVSDERGKEVYSALCDRVNTEIGTFWQRNDILLAVNFGLLALGFVDTARGLLLTLLLAIAGIAAAVLWFLVAKRGRAWLYFWEDKLADLEATMPGPNVFPGHWNERRDRIGRGEPRPVTTLVLPVPILVLILWVLLLAHTFLVGIVMIR